MDKSLTDNESLIARVQLLERERNELQRDIEQLCMQQSGPAYLGVATRMHFQRTAALEQEIEILKNNLAACVRENHNIQEELSEAYRIKSQLADLHSAEVSKNVEAEKQLKFFQGCVATAFAERDNAIMEAEKAKEKEELMPQELNKFQKKVEELTHELLEEKGLTATLGLDLEKLEKQNEVFKEVIDKFYDIRQCSLESFTDASFEEKCDCLLNDSAELWRFQNDEDTSTSNYISSLEAQVETLRKGVNNLQNKLQVGLEIETHLKKKVRKLEKKKLEEKDLQILSEEKVKKQISALRQYHSQYRMDIMSLLDEGNSELKSNVDVIVEKIRELEQSREQDLKSSLTKDTELVEKIRQLELSREQILKSSPPIQDTELAEAECKDVHINADSGLDSTAKSNNPSLPTLNSSGTGDTSAALAQALYEKVSTLLLLSQQEERHLLERNVNEALQKKIEELQRNLLQVTNEKVKALMELAQLKQEYYMLQEKMSEDSTQGKNTGEIREKKVVPENDGKLRNILKKTYLNRWVGGSDAAEAHLSYEKPSNQMDFARMKIENATLKESLGSMEHLLSSVRRLRISLLKVKDSAGEESGNTRCCYEALDQILAEANLVKTALSSSLPLSWSAETHGSDAGLDQGYEKVDFVSAAGFEMLELLIFGCLVVKDKIGHTERGNEEMVV